MFIMEITTINKMSIIYKTPKGSINYYGESARILNYMLNTVQNNLSKMEVNSWKLLCLRKKEIVM